MDEVGITNLAQYIIRSAFSIAKLNYNSIPGMVIYRLKMTHGRSKRNQLVRMARGIFFRHSLYY